MKVTVTTTDQNMPVPSRSTPDDLHRLCGHSAVGCVSIYMDLPEKRTTVTAYRARLRQLVRAASEQTSLAVNALTRVQAIEEFAREPNLWITDARGLAVFASGDALDTFYLDHPVQDLATVGDYHHVKPLLEEQASDHRCAVAVLSVDGARSYRVDRSGAHLFQECDLPERMSPSKRIPGVQFRTQPNAGATRGAMFHGHGAGADLKKKEVAKRLRAIDEWLCGQIDLVTGIPIILGGVTYLTAAFRPISKCPNILDETIDGSRLTQNDVADRAHGIMASAARDAFQNARRRYLELSGSSRVVTRYEQILHAAKNGRVDTAFVAGDRNQWQSGTQMGLREDVFDRIAAETYLADGKVFVVRETKLPSGEGACAILRY